MDTKYKVLAAPGPGGLVEHMESATDREYCLLPALNLQHARG
ncbi:MAG: hypothetical protein OXC42_04730 [Gammaproteobacteria bacterium]|nr:hypothetical protein [Gammaproteobacteria bacterium]